LTLLTLAPPHHRNSPSMAASPRRNHGSLGSSREFCNKIGPSRQFGAGEVWSRPDQSGHRSTRPRRNTICRNLGGGRGFSSRFL